MSPRGSIGNPGGTPGIIPGTSGAARAPASSGEGGAIKGRAEDSPVYKAAENKLEASLARPFFDRPGHWGVFLVARFDIGPAMWQRMRWHPFQHPEFKRWKTVSNLAVAGGR